SMCEKGLTASKIANELGSGSRNSVIGKAHLLVLKSRPSPVKATEKVAKPAKAPAAPKAAAPAPRPATPAAPRPIAPPRAEPKPVPEAAPADAGVDAPPAKPDAPRIVSIE